jgi:glutamate/tyrosine decarboxylase-like PLP-dependent enzyme
MSDPFGIDPEEMRRLGYAAIDAVVDHWSHLPNKPAMRVSSRETLESLLREPMPTVGCPPSQAIQTVLEHVFNSIGHLNHPRFFGFIPTPSNYVGVLADLLTSGFTPFCGTWLEGSGPAEIELVTLGWLKELFGFSTAAGGVFTSGGSLANLTALTAMRGPTSRPDGVVYYSDQTHSSVERALRILGFRYDQLHRIPSDPGFRLPVEAVEEAIRIDVGASLNPLGIVANAGTTNTGAVDSLDGLADVCVRHGMWLHVDGAYGAAAMLTERGKAALRGIDRVDSLTLDPHKWLFQPYVLGCTLVRDTMRLRECFQVMPEYLRDTETHRGEVNFCDYGPELTRPFRALKLWLSLKVFGADAFTLAIDHGIDIAEATEQMLREDSCWEVVSPASLGIVCFRYVKPHLSAEETDRLNADIAHHSAADGCCFISTTVLHSRTVLRVCTINPATTVRDLQLSLDCLRRYVQ